MDVATFFNELYRTHDRYWWRDKDRYATNPDAYPYSLIMQLTLRLLADRPPGRALDLGAGEGADSIRLALLGYQVDALDISEVAAEKIRKFAADAGVQVRVQLGDVADFIPQRPYDIVICNGLLQYVRDKEPVIRRMQDATQPGGLNVVSLWSTYTPVPDEHSCVPVFCDDEDGEVAKLYQDWEKELYYFEREKPEKSHSGMPPHSHSHIKLIARKPVACQAAAVRRVNR